jgi:hypothetical protein
MVPGACTGEFDLGDWWTNGWQIRYVDAWNRDHI